MPRFSHSDQGSLRAVFLRDMMLIPFLCEAARNDTALLLLNLRVAQTARPGWPGLWGTWFGWRCPCSLRGCWTTWPLKVPFNPNCSLILWFSNYMIWPINDFTSGRQWAFGKEYKIFKDWSSVPKNNNGAQKKWKSIGGELVVVENSWIYSRQSGKPWSSFRGIEQSTSLLPRVNWADILCFMIHEHILKAFTPGDRSLNESHESQVSIGKSTCNIQSTEDKLVSMILYIMTTWNK